MAETRGKRKFRSPTWMCTCNQQDGVETCPIHRTDLGKPAPVPEPTPQEFYEANATNICNVPRVGYPEDPSGWAGVRRASEARFVAGDALVMTLADAFDFAEKYKASFGRPRAGD